MPDSTLPLSGIRVVEFCQVLAGPFCGCLLADMGADVIKVEAPDGDLMRQWPPLVDGYSQYFASVNRNKRSVSAFGQSGPRAGEGGFDMTVQAISGVMSVTGEPDGRPAKCGIPIADFTTGLYAAYSVAAALRNVARGEPGAYIDVAMLGAMLGIANLQTSELFGAGRDPVRLGSAHPMNAPYAAFRCQDGYFALAAGTDKLWQAVCSGISRPDLAQDARFTSPSLRAAHQEALRDVLESEFAKYTAAELLDAFNARGVPCAPINRYSQVVADAQVEHMQWVENITLPDGHATRTVVSPQRISGRRLGVYRRPPALGEHTAEILAELE
ncbi:MAG: CoA transferase [Betaproteobacteria bacterium]|nr:CoA transferase [Betaproteobacteria bacterium]